VSAIKKADPGQALAIHDAAIAKLDVDRKRAADELAELAAAREQFRIERRRALDALKRLSPLKP